MMTPCQEVWSQAKNTLKTLPSAIYWSGLQTYGVFRAPLTLQQYAKAVARGALPPPEEDEFANRRASYWRETPDLPEGFFDKEKPVSLALTTDEAEWLRDRILSTESPMAPNLYAAWMREISANRSKPNSDYLWTGLPSSTSPSVRKIAHQAERFSLLIWAANNLYNLMLMEARRSRKLDSDGDEAQIAEYADNLIVWASRAEQMDLKTWAREIETLWVSISPRAVDQGARRFVTAWASIVGQCSLADMRDNEEARQLVRVREAQKKGPQARFGNERRLREFRGHAGTTELTFRWGVVQDIISDIAAGLNQDRVSVL